MSVVLCLLDGLLGIVLAGEGCLQTGFLELFGLLKTFCFAFGLLCLVFEFLSATETVAEKLEQKPVFFLINREHALSATLPSVVVRQLNESVGLLVELTDLALWINTAEIFVTDEVVQCCLRVQRIVVQTID